MSPVALLIGLLGLLAQAGDRAGAVERAEIREAIEGLRTSCGRCGGLQTVCGGLSFALYDGFAEFGSETLEVATEALRPRPSTAEGAQIRLLVEMGPKAIPQLLEALDDGRRTSCSWPNFGSRIQWNRERIPANPDNARENEILARHSALQEIEGHGPNWYTPTVGDMCFVVLGQITNRKYWPLHYFQVNSPSRDAAMVGALRELWGGEDVARKLLDSLMLDFRTSTEWGIDANAAMRLLTYFPDPSGMLVAERIEQLEDPCSERFLIQLSAITGEPDVAEVVMRLAESSDDPLVLCACIQPPLASIYPDRTFAALEEGIRRDASGENDELLFPWMMLNAAARVHPERSRPLFEVQMAHADADRKKMARDLVRGRADELPWACAFLDEHPRD